MVSRNGGSTMPCFANDLIDPAANHSNFSIAASAPNRADTCLSSTAPAAGGTAYGRATGMTNNVSAKTA